MKRFFKWSGIVAFAALLPLLMAPTGGIPTILRLSALGIGISPSATAGTLKISAVTDVAPLKIGFSGAGASNSGVIGFYDNASVRKGFVGDSSSGDSIISLACETASCNVDLATGAGGKATVNGIAIPRTAYGIVNTSGATCTSVTVASGVSGTCSHTGTGTYQITFSPVFASAPVCVASIAGALVFVTATAGTGTNASFVTFNTAFTQTDTSTAVNFVCTL